MATLAQTLSGASISIGGEAAGLGAFAALLVSFAVNAHISAAHRQVEDEH